MEKLWEDDNIINYKSKPKQDKPTTTVLSKNTTVLPAKSPKKEPQRIVTTPAPNTPPAPVVSDTGNPLTALPLQFMAGFIPKTEPSAIDRPMVGNQQPITQPVIKPVAVNLTPENRSVIESARKTSSKIATNQAENKINPTLIKPLPTSQENLNNIKIRFNAKDPTLTYNELKDLQNWARKNGKTQLMNQSSIVMKSIRDNGVGFGDSPGEMLARKQSVDLYNRDGSKMTNSQADNMYRMAAFLNGAVPFGLGKNIVKSVGVNPDVADSMYGSSAGTVGSLGTMTAGFGVANAAEQALVKSVPWLTKLVGNAGLAKKVTQGVLESAKVYSVMGSESLGRNLNSGMDFSEAFKKMNEEILPDTVLFGVMKGLPIKTTKQAEKLINPVKTSLALGALTAFKGGSSQEIADSILLGFMFSGSELLGHTKPVDITEAEITNGLPAPREMLALPSPENKLGLPAPDLTTSKNQQILEGEILKSEPLNPVIESRQELPAPPENKSLNAPDELLALPESKNVNFIRKPVTVVENKQSGQTGDIIGETKTGYVVRWHKPSLGETSINKKLVKILPNEIPVNTPEVAPGIITTLDNGIFKVGDRVFNEQKGLGTILPNNRVVWDNGFDARGELVGDTPLVKAGEVIPQSEVNNIVNQSEVTQPETPAIVPESPVRNEMPASEEIPVNAKEPWEMTRIEWESNQTLNNLENTNTDKAKIDVLSFIKNKNKPTKNMSVDDLQNIMNDMHKESLEKGMYNTSYENITTDTQKLFNDLAESYHKLSIKQALADGKPVPPEVLADYPDLSAKQVAPEPAPEVAKDVIATDGDYEYKIEPYNGDLDAKYHIVFRKKTSSNEWEHFGGYGKTKLESKSKFVNQYERIGNKDITDLLSSDNDILTESSKVIDFNNKTKQASENAKKKNEELEQQRKETQLKIQENKAVIQEEMKNAKFKKQEYPITTSNGEPKVVNGYVLGQWAYSKNEKGLYTITHLPTGLASYTSVTSLGEARELVYRFNKNIKDWNPTNKTDEPQRDWINSIIKEHDNFVNRELISKPAEIAPKPVTPRIKDGTRVSYIDAEGNKKSGEIDGYNGKEYAIADMSQNIHWIPKEDVTPRTKPVETTKPAEKSELTQENKQWAKDTKVTDKDGNPLVVYHGSKDLQLPEKLDAQHIYFTDSTNEARSYAGENISPLTGESYGKNAFKGKVHEFYLNIKNPKYLDYHEKYFTRDTNYMENQVKIWKEEGYDGIIMPWEGSDGSIHKNYIAFNSEQVKPVETTKPAEVKQAETGQGETFGGISEADASDALNIIKQKFNNMGIVYKDPIDAELLKSLYTYGKYQISKGFNTFESWSKKMIQEAGETVKPHLESLWARINDNINQGDAVTAKEETQQRDYDESLDNIKSWRNKQNPSISSVANTGIRKALNVVRNVANRITEEISNSLQPVDTDVIKPIGKKVVFADKATNNPIIMLNNQRKTTGIVSHIVKSGGALVTKAGNRIDVSLTDLFKEINNMVGKNREAFNLYLEHRLNVERHDQDVILTVPKDALSTISRKPEIDVRGDERTTARYKGQSAVIINQNVDGTYNIKLDKNYKPVKKQWTREASVNAVTAYEKSNPEFVKAAERLYGWQDKFMKEWAVGDIMTKELYDKMRAMYQSYVPARRVEDVELTPEGIQQPVNNNNTSSAGNFDKNTLGAKNPLKRATGGVSELQDFEKQIGENISRYVNATKKNEAFKTLLYWAKQQPDKLKFTMEVVPEKLKLPNKTMDELLDYIEDKNKGIGLSGVPGKYIVRIFQNGEITTLRINDNLYRALNDNTYLETLGKVTDVVNEPVKYTITGGNIIFTTRNVPMDFQTYMINTIETNPVKAIATYNTALKEMVMNSERWQQYESLGNIHSTLNYQANKGWVGKGIESNKIFQALGNFQQGAESIARFAEWINTVEKNGGNYDNYDALQLANFNAANITTDFSRHGRTMQALDKAGFLYANAAVQGVARNFKQVVDKPVESALKLLAYQIVPTMVLAAFNGGNKNYNDLPDRDKDAYFMLPNLLGEKDKDGNATTFTKIPKVRGYRIIGNLLERAYRLTREIPEKAFNGYMTNALAEIGISNTSLNPLNNNIFATWLKIWNLQNNRTEVDWKNTPYLPKTLQDVIPSEQYNMQTGELAKEIGKAVRDLKVPDLFKSPIQLEAFVKATIGGVYQVMTPITDYAIKSIKAKQLLPVSKDNFDIMRPWTADPTYNSELSNKFFTDINTVLATTRDAENKMEYDTKYKMTKEVKSMFERRDDAADYLSEVLSMIKDVREIEKEIEYSKRQIPSEAQRKDLKSLKKEINNMQREYLDNFYYKRKK